MSNLPNPLGERSLQLGTRPQGGRSIRLKINPNRYNRVSLSARVNDNWIGVDLTVDTWSDLMGFIEAAARSKEATTYDIQCSKSNQHDGTITAGRDDDGLVYLELSKPNGGKARFEFLPLRQYVSLHNGSPMPESDVTRRRAIRWVGLVDPIVRKQWNIAYKEEQPQNSYGGNNNGGNNNYQRPQGNNNNYQRPQGGNNNYQQGGNGGYQKPASAPPVADGDLESYLP